MSTNPFSLSKVKHVIAISSCKGGVGKSTIASALAWELSQRGLKDRTFGCGYLWPVLTLAFSAARYEGAI